MKKDSFNNKTPKIKWITEQKMQELTGLRTTTLWKLRMEGKLKFAKVGRRTYYDWEDFERHLEDNSFDAFNL